MHPYPHSERKKWIDAREFGDTDTAMGGLALSLFLERTKTQ
jgi:hypothetical protein